MVRAFTSADFGKQGSGITTGAGVTDPGVALASPATEGLGGLIVLGAQNPIDAPEQWDMIAESGAAAGSPQLGVMVRPCLPAGDQSWTFVAVGGFGTLWAWIAEEVANLSYAPILGAASPMLVKDPAGGTYTIGSTGAWSAPYAVGIAALLMINSHDVTEPAPTVWPTSVGWSNSFTETDVFTRGDGTVDTDMQLRVARRYGTLDDAGSWSTVVTLGTTSGKNCYGAMGVFRAEYQAGDI